MMLEQSFAAMALMAAIAGHAETVAPPASGSCDHAPTTSSEPASVVSTPDYRGGARENDAADDVQAKALLQPWLDYQRSVVDAMRHSADPRDRAVAALIPDLEFGETAEHRHDASALLEHALHDSRGDPLVLWIAIQHGTADNGAARDIALQRLTEIEPENAAVWLAALDDAAARKD